MKGKKNCGNYYRKYAIGGFDIHLLSAVDVTVAAVLFVLLLLR